MQTEYYKKVEESQVRNSFMTVYISLLHKHAKKFSTTFIHSESLWKFATGIIAIV
jgi:hypothetical protein